MCSSLVTIERLETNMALKHGRCQINDDTLDRKKLNISKNIKHKIQCNNIFSEKEEPNKTHN